MIFVGNINNAVGNTPLIELKNFAELNKASAKLFAKYEAVNPAGSIKDRVALNMLDDAYGKGKIKDGAVIIEPTSGNTGIGLAAIGAARGYKVILTMPDTMSPERIALLEAYGAKVVLTPGAEGMDGAVKKANELAKSYENSFIPGQFDNPANSEAHYKTTGPEIWQQTKGKIDIFAACIGTGGTLCGTAKYLKEQNPDIEVIGIEPFESPLITKGVAGSHIIQGIGANFIPKNYDKSVVDKVITVKGEDAKAYTKQLAVYEGLLVGISSGAAAKALLDIANNPQNRGKTIVTVFPDSGSRYMSCGIFDNE